LADIQDCPRVLCDGKAACSFATIHGFTHEVLCTGSHACQRAQMVAAASSVVQDTDFQRNVVCLGSGSCDVANIDYNEAQAMDVYCIGSKACRRAKITAGDGVVTCRDAGKNSQYLACMGNTQITSKCLRCEDRGCKPYINECNYKLSMDIDAHAQKCEGNMGECPAEMSDSSVTSGSGSGEPGEEQVLDGVVQEGEIDVDTKQVQPGEP
jgi:hypothetical protein